MSLVERRVVALPRIPIAFVIVIGFSWNPHVA
jgi:hypothetical protein